SRSCAAAPRKGDPASASVPLPKVLRAPFWNPQFCGRSDVTPCSGWFELSCVTRGSTMSNLASHVVIALVVQHVAHKQNNGLISQVLPPMGRAAGLWPHLTSFVQNRNRAATGIFDDLAFCDVDDRGTVAVTVPRHDAAWLDSEFAEPELTLLDVCRLLFK